MNTKSRHSRHRWWPGLAMPLLLYAAAQGACSDKPKHEIPDYAKLTTTDGFETIFEGTYDTSFVRVRFGLYGSNLELTGLPTALERRLETNGWHVEPSGHFDLDPLDADAQLGSACLGYANFRARSTVFADLVRWQHEEAVTASEGYATLIMVDVWDC